MSPRRSSLSSVFSHIERAKRFAALLPHYKVTIPGLQQCTRSVLFVLSAPLVLNTKARAIGTCALQRSFWSLFGW